MKTIHVILHVIYLYIHRMMHTTQSPLYVEPYANWGALETSGGGSSV